MCTFMLGGYCVYIGEFAHVKAQGLFGNLSDHSSTVFFESMSLSEIQNLIIQLQTCSENPLFLFPHEAGITGGQIPLP